MRGEDEGEAKGLRRLHGSQRRARRGREDTPVDVDLLYGVVHRSSGRRSPMTLGGLDRAAHQVDRREGPRCIVDEHDVHVRYGEGLEPGENALLAGRAPDRRRPERRRGARRQLRRRVVIERAIVSADDHRYGGEREARGQRLKRMHDERTAGAIEILLRPICAKPHAPAGGDDQKPDLIR
jgi:hypothetical protein